MTTLLEIFKILAKTLFESLFIMLLTRTYGKFTATFIGLESNQCYSSVLAEYRDTDFIHIREDGIESVSKNFIPVLFKIELHLQQFHSGDYHFIRC